MSSSISFWLPSAGIVYFYYEVNSKHDPLTSHNLRQITKCAVEKSRADAMVRRSTCSASSALTQYSGSSSAHQVLLEPYSNTAGSGLASPHSPRPSTASHPGSIARNYSVSPHIDRFGPAQ